MAITVPIRKSKNLNIIVMSRIVVIFIALFCYADCMMADSFFIESGIKYKVVDDGHVNVAVQDDSLYSSYAFKDYVLEIPAVVRHDGRSYRVKEIEKFAFTACCAIKHLKIGEGIEAISDYAFQACANLESVSIPSSIRVIGAAPFGYCSNLKEVVLPATMETFIGGSNFGYCTSLEPITLSVSQVERDLFMRKYQVTIHLNNLFQKAKQLDNG
jgi:hypothetical protein